MKIVKVYGLDGFYGKCHPKEGLILLNIDNSPKEDFDTLVHELLHLVAYKLLGRYSFLVDNSIDWLSRSRK